MRSQGYSLREIAAAVGYSHEAVRIVLYSMWRFPSRVALRKKPRLERGCKISGCRRKHSARGYCGAHRYRIKHGTMDEHGKPLPVRHICRICGNDFYVPARSANRIMCDKCRPPLPEERASLRDVAKRHKRVLMLSKAGARLETIAGAVGLAPSTVRIILRNGSASRPSLMERVRAGLCAKCGEKRNRYSHNCDRCHEEAMVKQRNNLRLRYKQVPRCNAIGCRFKPVSRGFCGDCHSAWKAGKIDFQGKHVLSTCLECPCKFIPSRAGQRRCLGCARGGAHRRKQ
jgi:DNA-binding CsgD family transcriptional regulator